MNLITSQVRNEVYASLSEVGKFLYAHPNSGKSLTQIAEKYNLKDSYKTFAVTIGDIILGFYKAEDTIPLLQQELELDQATADKLGSEVLDFLAPLSDPTWQPPTEEGIESSDPSINVSSTVTLPVSQSLVQIEEPTAIPEIRTMAADMAIERSPARSTFNAAAEIDEPIYVSNQPILEKKVIDVPSYSTPHRPSPQPDAPATDSRWN